jgi:uncharacterized damage-inducible protein DinB
MQPLRVMFDHHTWATRELITRCEDLTEEQLNLSLPGTYGGILNTLIHLVAEDQRLSQRLSSQSEVKFPLTEDGPHGISDLHSAWSAQTERWDDVVARIDDIHATLPARGRWPEVAPAEDLILLEAIQHGNDHRTHISTVLSAHGLHSPLLCGWQFWQATGRVKMETDPA